MKRYFYPILAVVVCSVLVCCNQKNNEVIITGQLEGIADGVIVRLMKPEGNLLVSQQSDTVVNGAFSFSFPDTLDYAKPMNISASGDGLLSVLLELWIKPGAKVKIIGKDKLVRSWEVTSSIPEQKEANIYKKKTDLNERAFQSVVMEAYSYQDEISKSPTGANSNFRAKVDSLYAVSDSLYAIVIETEIDMMDENKTYSSVWMGKLETYARSLKYLKISDMHAKKLKSMYESMSEELKHSEKGISIHANLYPPVIVKEGEDMADADMWDINGELRHLADYKGKYLLLDFWSSGCGPCLMAIPEMKEISDIYKDKLVVVSISSDPKNLWESTSKEKDITWVNLNDFKTGNGIWLRYGVTGIPHYVIISPEGKVLTTWMGYGEGLLKRKMKEFI